MGVLGACPNENLCWEITQKPRPKAPAELRIGILLEVRAFKNCTGNSNRIQSNILQLFIG